MNKAFMLSVLVLVLLLSGCMNKTPVYIEESEVKPCTTCSKKQIKKQVKKQENKSYMYMPYMKSVPFASSDENRMKKLVSDLSLQLIQNNSSSNIKNRPMSISSFTPLNGMDSNENLSAILSEYLIYEMQVRGHKVLENKVQSSNDKAHMNNILRGTYSSYKNSVVVNARIVDVKTDIVLSSAQVLIPIQVVNRVTSNKNKGK